VTHDEMIAKARALTRDVAGTGRSVQTWQDLFNLEQDDFSDEVPSVHELDSTHTLLATTSEIALPNDFILSTIPLVFLTDPGDLEYLRPEDLPVPPPPGNPAAYSIMGRSIRFDAAPSTATTVRVRSARRPPAVVASSSAPIVDPEWHRGIMYGGVAKAFFADRNEIQGAYYEAKAQAVRDRAARASSTRHRQRRSKEDE